jgi:hypothetical protein
MQSSNKEFTHPELMELEIFFSNASLACFQELPLKTKRKGLIAYDGVGGKLSLEDWFPVFLKESEITDLNASLPDLRRTFHAICPR